jgi:hypothetical protein
VRRTEPELLVDTQLVRAALWCPAALAVPAALLAYATGGARAATAALYGIAVVGLTAYAAALVSKCGGTTARGIGVVRVTAAVPARLVLIALALAAGVGPLGFPSRVVALAVCAGEIAVLTAQSLVVLRGRTFVGPITGKAY